MRWLLFFIINTFCTIHLYSQRIETVVGGGAGGGTDGYGSGLPATNVTLGNLAGITFDNYGNLIIADKDRGIIRKVDINTTIVTTIAGNGINGFSGDGGPATDAKINFPGWLCVTKDNEILFADRSNNRIRKIATDGVISTIVGTGASGYTGDGGPATLATIAGAQGVCLDTSGNCLISTQYSLRMYNSTSSIILRVAGDGTAGSSGDGGAATMAQFESLYGIRCDRFNNVYIADWYDNRIRKVNLSTGLISTAAGNGIFSYSGDNIPATTTGIDPYDVAVDDSANLYIADLTNNRIRKVNTSGVITTVAGTGLTGFGGDGGLATDAVLNRPAGLAMDKCGNLYIADNQNYRIRKVTFNAYSTPTVTVTGMSSATVGATVSVHAAVSGGVGAYRINWYRNGTLLAVTDTPGVTYIKGMGTDTISAHALPSVVYCSDSAASPVWEVAEIPVGIADVRRMGVTIYPNPTRSMLHVSGEGPLEEVALETVTGQEIVNMHVQGMRAEMDMSGLPAGLYLLRVNRLQVYKVWRE